MKAEILKFYTLALKRQLLELIKLSLDLYCLSLLTFALGML